MEMAREMSISAQILQKRKELEKLEHQAKMEKANDTIDAVVKEIADRDHVREVLGDFSPEEGSAITGLAEHRGNKSRRRIPRGREAGGHGTMGETDRDF